MSMGQIALVNRINVEHIEQIAIRNRDTNKWGVLEQQPWTIRQRSKLSEI